MAKWVICTRHDGGVTRIAPSWRCVGVLKEGGGLWFGVAKRISLSHFMSEALRLTPDQIRAIRRINLLPLEIARAWEIHKLVRDPQWRPDHLDREAFAAQWIDGLIHGGYDERDALLLIGEYSKPAFATALDIVGADDLPDETYRAAWRRSPNGGPIIIDEDKARAIGEARAWAAYERDAA